MSATTKLAKYAARTRYGDLPEEVVDKAKLLMLDALGCTLAGSQTPPAQIIIDTIKKLNIKYKHILKKLNYEIETH